ncbi:MAG: hypothetical protein IJM21_03410 [Clostridia bacterium]|nr:hypothetical protein [Clostridia bacterium]
MKNKIILASGAAMTIAVTITYSLLLLNGISSQTGLITNQVLLYLADGLSFVLTAYWLFAALFFLNLPFRICKKRDRSLEKQKAQDEKKKEKNLPRSVDRLVLDKLPKHAAVFYVAFLFVFLAADLFLILYTAKEFSTFHLALSVFSVLSTFAFMRAAVIHVTESVKGYDVFLLPLPIVFATLFAVFAYQNVAKMPQISVYYPEIFAIMGTVLLFYLFTSHFFGDPARRFHVFAALFATAFGAVTYLARLVVLFSRFFASQIVSAGDYFADIASLMLYAASAILGAVYLMLLFNSRGELAEDGKPS